MVITEEDLQELILHGNALARSIGHDPANRGGRPHSCPKMSSAVPCTCGAGKQQAQALDNWMRAAATIEAKILLDKQQQSV